ncbi:hypothetical protein, partial [Paenibacillus xylanexedens]|uniref:hypothetical protein n=1 Tax=Paenibacillus xylanexedens TaxID=528191 RepID=UPI001C92EAAE
MNVFDMEESVMWCGDVYMRILDDKVLMWGEVAVGVRDGCLDGCCLVMFVKYFEMDKIGKERRGVGLF